MLITVGAIMAWAIPRIQQMEYDAQYDGVFSGFQLFDSRADDVIYGGAGTSRSFGMSVGGGDIFLAHDNGYILTYWSLIPENITMSWVDSDGEFTFAFDQLSSVNLTVNITGTGGEGAFTASLFTGTSIFTSSADVGRVEPGFKFGDLQYIRIHNSTQDLAEIYYFKMRVLEHEFPTSSGYFEIKWMNGAIITNRGSSIGAVTDTPYVYHKGDFLFMNIIDLKANRSGFSSGGRGSYSITIKNMGSELLTSRSVYGFKMSMHTKYTKGWNIYYINHRDFTAVKDKDYRTIAVGYNAGGFTKLKLMLTKLETTGRT